MSSRRSFDLFVCFARKGLLLDLKLQDLSLKHIDLLRQRVDLDADPRCRFVNKVNRLVRQKTVGDIAIGKRGRGNYGGVFDADAVMNFVAFLQTAKYRNGVLYGGFADINLLEPAFESLVLFNVFLIFGKRSRSDCCEACLVQVPA